MAITKIRPTLRTQNLWLACPTRRLFFFCLVSYQNWVNRSAIPAHWQFHSGFQFSYQRTSFLHFAIRLYAHRDLYRLSSPNTVENSFFNFSSLAQENIDKHEMKMFQTLCGMCRPDKIVIYVIAVSLDAITGLKWFIKNSHFTVTCHFPFNRDIVSI